MRAIRKGKQTVAITTATMGSGLKLKKGVSEKGNVAICINPDIVSQIGKMPMIRKAGRRDLLCSRVVQTSPTLELSDKVRLFVTYPLIFLALISLPLLLVPLTKSLLVDRIPRKEPMLQRV